MRRSDKKPSGDNPAALDRKIEEPKIDAPRLERDAKGRYRKGTCPNPRGRRPGDRNRSTLAAEALLDGEVEGLTRRCIEAALGGDMVAMKLCLERILPIRRRVATPLALPAMETAADLLPALGRITEAAASGALDLDAAGVLANLVEAKRRALETIDLEARIAALESGS